MNKRGQFFLIGAIVIIVIIIGFATVQNILKKGITPSDKVYYLQEELGFEGGKVIDYGVIRGSDVKTIMETFTKEYSQYAGDQKSLYFVFGDKNKVTVAGWQDVSIGSVGLSIGNNNNPQVKISKRQYEKKEQTISGSDSIEIIIDNNSPEKQTRTFKLQEGQNFYFVIQQNVGDEIIIVDSETEKKND